MVSQETMIADNVKKIPIHAVVTCTVEASIDEIAKKLRDKKERRIFVIDKNEKLSGIITTTDLVYKALCNCKQVEKMKAKDVMVKEVKAVDVNNSLENALEIMNDLKTLTCPVVDNGKIIGVLSYHELVNHVFNKL